MNQPLVDPATIFRQEAGDILEQLESVLLDLERMPEDRGLIDAAFRAMHTLKGSGAMFGFESVAAFTHGFETTFDRVRKGLIPASPAIVAVSLKARDHIRALIEAPDAADAARGAAILSELEAISAQGGRPAPAALPPGLAAPAARPAAGAASATAGTRLRLRFNGPILANGTDPLRLIDELRDFGPCTVRALIDRVPPLAELDPDHCHIGWQVDLPASVTRQDVEDVFMFVIDDMELDFAAIPADEPAVPASGAKASASMPAAPPTAKTPKAMTPQVAAPQAAPEPAEAARAAAGGGSSAGQAGGETVRVPAERLDDLMDRVGELVIQQARLAQLAEAMAEPALKTVAEDIGRLAAGLRDTAMNIRLVPIGTLFGRFRRLVRDLSGDLGKPVELVMEGEETELDKTVIERLADPLTHMIRNSLDHGLETPDDRVRAGKPPLGRLTLSARHAGAEVQVTVSDDGRGLDRVRIRAKAEENGLVAAGAVLSDNELLRLVFEPGFSTAREVSALSGRGVGMDVVKRTIEALRGSIDLASTPGVGTAFTLRLPLTLAIIEGLLVELGGARYVIPLAAVQECVELGAAGSGGERRLLDIRGELVPFLPLRELFVELPSIDPHQKVVVVASGEMRVGLVVDRILGSHQTVIKSLSKLHADVRTFSGATILADGTAALILDIPQLIERGQAQGRRPAVQAQEAA